MNRLSINAVYILSVFSCLNYCGDAFIEEYFVEKFCQKTINLALPIESTEVNSDHIDGIIKDACSNIHKNDTEMEISTCINQTKEYQGNFSSKDFHNFITQQFCNDGSNDQQTVDDLSSIGCSECLAMINFTLVILHSPMLLERITEAIDKTCYFLSFIWTECGQFATNGFLMYADNLKKGESLQVCQSLNICNNRNLSENSGNQSLLNEQK
uniref:Saposin B-type domain-containing protein n=1 Tax=Trichobilharzia regenti TaxID=157069 RepID=A0AA85KA16_TRIRE|nr:unnamed protein product [Trichobilharzia regenti]